MHGCDYGRIYGQNDALQDSVWKRQIGRKESWE